MATPALNAPEPSLIDISRASKLKGKLLLIHGSADDNVHLQNFMEYSEALVQANIQFDTQIYTNLITVSSEEIPATNLMNRVANFFLQKPIIFHVADDTSHKKLVSSVFLCSFILPL